MSKPVTGLLLAAGSSRRFGSQKLLHTLDGKESMLMVSARNLVKVLPDSIVVINNKLLDVKRPLEELGFKVVINKDADKGMGTSIACGVENTNDSFAWLIALADMPYISQVTMEKIVARLKAGAEIVAPVFNNQRGHPVGFSQQYKAELLALNQDIGAREIIQNNLSVLEQVECDDNGVLIDIDTPGDLGLV